MQNPSASSTLRRDNDDFEPEGKWALSAFLLALLAGLLSHGRRLGRAAALRLRWATATALALSTAACGGGSSADDDIDLEGTVQTLSPADTLLFTDQLGSLLSETDGTGAVQAEFAALPYGAARTNTSTQTQKYAGAPRDESVGLDQMGARFYSPDLGIWTSPDPVVIDEPELLISGEYATGNPYAYANLNPVIAKDEDGNFWHIAAGAAVGAVFGGAVEAATQYVQHGEVKDWGRVGAAAAGGAVSGAITAAVPGAGIASRALSNSVSSVAEGMTTRAISSGGASVGSVTEILTDATIGAVTAGRGSAKPKPHPQPKAKPASQAPGASGGGGGVATPHGAATQSTSPAALDALDRVESGATVYRQGTFDVQHTADAQFWSLQNPASTKGFAEQMGMPGGSAKPDWIMGGTVSPGSAVVTRPAPGIGSNAGGSMEAVVPSGSVGKLWFHMPD